MANTQNIVKALQGSLTTGVVAGLGAAFLLGESGSVQFAGLQVPIAVALGGAVMLGDAVSGIVSPFIFEEIPVIGRFQQIGSGLTSAAISGGISVLVVNLLVDAPMASPMNLFLLGAGSSFVGDSINSMLFAAESAAIDEF